MTIIQEIHAWSKGLPAWQQDAIARLYQDRTLSAADLDDLYAFVKAEVGILDTVDRKPKKLEDSQIAPPADPTRIVQLAAIKELSNVNALANGGSVPIALAGLTVIYGENGAGKSGYARAFKHACRARDRREPILPNANLDPKIVGVAQAVFETVIDGVTTDLPWQYGVAAPEPLSDISIFDTHCARAYIDNHGDFAYAPYGLDILEGLAGACNKLKVRATQEKAANAPSDAAYAVLAKEQTAVATALLGIPTKTKPEHIETLAALSQIEQDRLTLLTKTLAEADPKQKAQALRQKANRMPRKLDYAARDEANRKLGRAGEQWVIEFEQQRLTESGHPELFQRLDWVSDSQGDGAGFDILSFEYDARHRFIEVKTTNGGLGSSFLVSHNELEFSREVCEQFYLYRVFQFREGPRLFIFHRKVKTTGFQPVSFSATMRGWRASAWITDTAVIRSTRSSITLFGWLSTDTRCSAVRLLSECESW